jgi:hypothetical protein
LSFFEKDIMGIPFFLRIAASGVLSCSLLGASSFAGDLPAVKRKLNLPPSADLDYSIKARQAGFSLSGDALLQWRAGDDRFMVATETRAMLVGKILSSRSEGGIDNYGLAPASFTEKRFRKDQTIASFDRQTMTISFSASRETYSIQGGEQDRSSVIWQLLSIARASPEKFRPGSEWTFFVAGQRDAEPWIFKVIKAERISTPMGETDAVHISRAPPPDSKGQQLEIWLAPSHEWYPARLRFTEENGDVIEQSLVSIGRPPV